MSSQRIKVILNPDREEDRRILDYLLYCGEPKSKVFKMALLQYMEAKTEDGSYEKLLREIRKVIRDELRNAQPYGKSIIHRHIQARYTADNTRHTGRSKHPFPC